MTTSAVLLVAQLAYAREDAGLRQEDVGARIGRGRSTVRSWEHGLTWPPLDGVVAYADALGYDVVLVPRDGDAAPVTGRLQVIRGRPGLRRPKPTTPA